jgi:hypothetical protein
MANQTEVAFHKNQSLDRVRFDAAALNGSEKQVSWACDIRADYIMRIYNLPWQNDAQRDAVINYLVSVTSAKFWIDARETAAHVLAHGAAKEAGII